MKPALHIFTKDARRLWPQILVVLSLFTIYGMSPPGTGGAGITSLAERGNLLSMLVVIACWVLGANLIHEDALAEESPFWITRPYRRFSLLTAKVLFVIAFVFLPLLASGILLEARTGVNVAANAGTLFALDLAVSTWLILPVLAIGAVTRDLKTFAGGVMILALAYYPIARWTVSTANLASLAPTPDGPNIAAILPMILAAIGVVALQYAARKTQWSRGVLALAVIVSAFLMPRTGVALLSTRVANPAGFDVSRIQISFDGVVMPTFGYPRTPGIRGTCPGFPLKVEGLPPGIVLRPFGPPVAEASSVLTGPRAIRQALFEDTPDGYREYLCVPGPFTSNPDAIRATLTFLVVAVKPVAAIPPRPGSFAAGDFGRCAVVTPFPENTQLRCNLEKPLIGNISAGLEFPGYKLYSDSFVRYNGPVRLSPVSLEKFDGVSLNTPGGWPFEEAAARPDAHFILRTERVVGSVQRDLIYRDFRYPWTRFPPRPPSPPKKK